MVEGPSPHFKTQSDKVFSLILNYTVIRDHTTSSILSNTLHATLYFTNRLISIIHVNIISTTNTHKERQCETQITACYCYSSLISCYCICCFNNTNVALSLKMISVWPWLWSIHLYHCTHMQDFLYPPYLLL